MTKKNRTAVIISAGFAERKGDPIVGDCWVRIIHEEDGKEYVYLEGEYVLLEDLKEPWYSVERIEYRLRVR